MNNQTIMNVKIILLTIVLMLYSCIESRTPISKPLTKDVDKSKLFFDNIDIGTYKLFYSDKKNFGIKKPNQYDINTEEGYKRFFKYLRDRDYIGITFSGGFENDTVSLFHNSSLTYYNENITTNYSVLLAGGTRIKLYKDKANYLGVKINTSKVYWCDIDKEYLGITITNNNDSIGVSFNSKFTYYE